MVKIINKIEESAVVLNLLLVLGFLGIVWLMIYGNLSGNLGFERTSLSFTNETINLNDAGESPASTAGRLNPVLSNVVLTNSSGTGDGVGEIIAVGNYSISTITIRNLTVDFGGQNVNVSYTVTFADVGEVNAESVIDNMTTGVKTFFGFSNTFFTITAIVLLITILLGLLAIALIILKSVKGKGSGGFAD